MSGFLIITLLIVSSIVAGLFFYLVAPKLGGVSDILLGVSFLALLWLFEPAHNVLFQPVLEFNGRVLEFFPITLFGIITTFISVLVLYGRWK